jgi:hypothetical protein
LKNRSTVGLSVGFFGCAGAMGNGYCWFGVGSGGGKGKMVI